MCQFATMESTYNTYDVGIMRADRSSFQLQMQPATLSTYHSLKSSNNNVQYFYSLTQYKFLTENAALRQLRASAQENRAKGGRSQKFNLSSFSVYREKLTSFQTSWSLFSKIRLSKSL